ncbi:hypothetical protein [Streptomyces sp. UNOC14_S4]|uniref:hypothetical protein n=1 Tax=Streptomyces sp. UNOC14_S4 TaxID=2872340 RepID=UPI001E317968|nr:hypothetical protein [Streptomyces sp. UNOC14_S4]MCC3766889.1 hypothetical protein [Streptomyces sp. UNOC14_S4]
MADGDGDPPARPWWRRPAFVTAATAVAVAAIGSWLTQGGISLVGGLFGNDDKAAPPLVSVQPLDTAMCNVWLLRQDPQHVADTLTRELSRDAPDPRADREKQSAIADRIRKETGSRLATGGVVDVTVQGPKDKAIVLTGLELDLKHRSRDVPGKRMAMGTGCGADIPPRRYAAALDDPAPAFKLEQQLPDGTLDPKAVGFPYKVSAGDPEYLHLESWCDDYVEWTAKLRWVSDGVQGTTEINDKGKPFRTFSGDSEAADFRYDNETFTLTPVPHNP